MNKQQHRTGTVQLTWQSVLFYFTNVKHIFTVFTHVIHSASIKDA